MLWQEVVGIKKYHLVSWPLVCQPKDQGGLGILDLEAMNKCLLGELFLLIIFFQI